MAGDQMEAGAAISWSRDPGWPSSPSPSSFSLLGPLATRQGDSYITRSTPPPSLLPLYSSSSSHRASSHSFSLETRHHIDHRHRKQHSHRVLPRSCVSCQSALVSSRLASGGVLGVRTANLWLLTFRSSTSLSGFAYVIRQYR